MMRFRTLFAAPVFVMLMGGTAHAALTADQVWQGWKDTAGQAGAKLEAATEVKDGGALKLTGVSLKPGDGSGAALTVAELTLTEQADGSVTVVPGADLKVDGAGEPGSGTATVSGEGLTVTIAEGETGLDYDIVADALRLALDMKHAPAVPPAEGQTAEDATLVVNAAFNGLEGGWTGADGDNQSVAITLDADSLVYDLAQKDASAGANSVQTSETTEVSLEADFTLPKTLALAALTSPEAFAAALREGMALDLTMSQATSKGTSKEESPFMPMELAYEGGAGKTDLTVDETGLVMDATGDSMDISFKSPMVPVPEVKLTTSELAMGMTMPLVGGEEPGDYGLKLKLADIVLNEEAWGLFDPSKVFPRDPAQLALDVGGKIKADFLALAAAQEGGMTQVTPPEPLSFDVRELLLEVAGASLTGTGAFTFDNAQVAQGGQPIPVGTGTVTLTGGNKLVDGIVATGLMTEQDAAGPRMMMGAFMRPGDGEDVLVSDIEAKADGQILVNGQRVQ